MWVSVFGSEKEKAAWRKGCAFCKEKEAEEVRRGETKMKECARKDETRMRSNEIDKRVLLNRLCIHGLLFHTCGQSTKGIGTGRFALQRAHTNTDAKLPPPTSARACTPPLSGRGASVSLATLPVAPVTMTPGFCSLLKTLERQKMSVDSMKRPLMMAALNGLYVARMPVPESPAEDGAKAATDERVRCSFSQGNVFVCLFFNHF